MLFASDPRIMPIRAVSMLYPSAYGALPHWIPAKGSGPWNPLMGLFSGEGQPRPFNARVGPPLRTNPIERLQRVWPVAGVQGQTLWRVSGRSPALQPVRAIATTRRRPRLLDLTRAAVFSPP